MKRRILVIEDHEDTVALVSLIMNEAGVDSIMVGSVQEGLNTARSERFDLILMDNRLPDGDGIDLCRSIREFDNSTPIVFYTASAYPVDRRRALMAGAQRYLVKPNDMQILEKTILELLTGQKNGLKGNNE